VIVWERDPDGKRYKTTYPGIFEFYSKHVGGSYANIYGDNLIKHEFKTWFDMHSAKKQFTERAELLYESDILPEMKVLSEHYYQAEPPKLHYTLWDIEVDYDPSLAYADTAIDNAVAPINAVAIHHKWSGESIVIAVPPPSWTGSLKESTEKLSDLATETNTTILLVATEADLITTLLDEFEGSDVISGWNSSWFDTPYLAKRVLSVLGPKAFNRLSFAGAGKPSFRTVEVFGQERITIDLSGRISWDYMELFKKFEMNERPSYSLEAISNEILPDLPKLEYDGTLHELYNNDFEHFIRYNIRDTEVLAGFEDKLGYLALANVLYHSSCGQPNQIFGTIRLADHAIINYCHNELNRKVPDWDMYKQDGRIAGAMVLTPQIGLHQNIGSIDITSLYPSAIRCINISPETLIGQMNGTLDMDDRAKHSAWDSVYRSDTRDPITLIYDNGVDGWSGAETHTGKEWQQILVDRKWAISGYGTIFRQDVQGMIPAVLTEWFGQRKKYKKLMVEAKDSAEAILDKYR